MLVYVVGGRCLLSHEKAVPTKTSFKLITVLAGSVLESMSAQS